MFIQTQTTPNPNALKFLPGIMVSNEPIYITSPDSSNSNLVKKLFDAHDIEAVFFGSDFITITKNEGSDWDVVKPKMIMIIMDHFVAGLPVFEDDNQKLSSISSDDLTEIEKQIIEIIDTKVRPSVAMDGGDIVYINFAEGVVTLELRGACSGCPSSTITLKQGIESMLKYYIPEVKSVEAVS